MINIIGIMHVGYHVNILGINIKGYKKMQMKKWIHAIYSENRGFFKLGSHIGRGLKKMIWEVFSNIFLK